MEIIYIYIYIYIIFKFYVMNFHFKIIYIIKYNYETGKLYLNFIKTHESK